MLDKIKKLFSRRKKAHYYAVLLYNGEKYQLSSTVHTTRQAAEQWARELSLTTRSLTILGVISFDLPNET